MAEQQQPIPIVEHLPNAERPHPTIDESAPAGTIGHPDAALEHRPIEHKGQIIGAPAGYGQNIQVLGEKEAEALIKENDPDESEHWWGKLLKRKAQKEELPKAA